MKKDPNPLLKTVFELGPLLLFFAGFFALRGKSITLSGVEYGGLVLLSALFVPLIVVSTFALWKITGEISKMQVFTAISVVILGGASVWFNDARFLKMKPTILYLVFALILGFGLLRGQSYIGYLMGNALPLCERGWNILTRRFVGFFLVLALGNEIVWRGFSDEIWVSFKTFGIPLATLLFIIAQAGLFSRYNLDSDADSKAENDNAKE